MNKEYVLELKKRGGKSSKPVDEDVYPVEDGKDAAQPLMPQVGRKKKSTQPVSIYVTDSAIHVLQMETDNTVTGFGTVPLSNGVMSKGKITDGVQFKNALHTLISDITPTAKNASLEGAFCIPKSQTYIYHLVLSANEKDDADIRAVIAKRLATMVVFPVEDISFDYTLDSEKDRTHVTVVVVPHAVLLSYIEAFQQAGITLVLVDVEAAVLGSSLIPEKERQGSLIVDVGETSTSLNVYNGQKLVTSLFTPTGVEKLLQEQVRNTTATAERMHANTSNERASESVLTQSITALIQQLEKEHESLEIEHVYLAGNSEHLPRVASYITQTLGVKASIGSIMHHIAGEERSITVEYAPAVGLALRLLDANRFGFTLPMTKDLEPGYEASVLTKLFHVIRAKKVFIGAGLLALVIVLGLTYVLL